MKHFLANEWDKAKAQKRSGGKCLLSIDVAGMESSLGLDLAERSSADSTSNAAGP